MIIIHAHYSPLHCYALVIKFQPQDLVMNSQGCPHVYMYSDGTFDFFSVKKKGCMLRRHDVMMTLSS
jgi:hypothetical protein